MIIYLVTNIVNGKKYIGKTTGIFKNRKNRHHWDAFNNNDTFVFHEAIRKYGKDNFTWRVLKSDINDFLMLNIMETFMIMVHHTHVSENGYNMTWGGDGCYGYKHTDERKQKIKEKRKFQIYSNEVKKRISNTLKGRKLSDETKQKISLANTGKKRTDETKQKISLAFKGKSKTDEHKNALSKSIIEWHKKNNNPWKGKKHSIVTKNKLSEMKRIYDDDIIIRAGELKNQGMKCFSISKLLKVSQGAVERWNKNNFYNLVRKK
jgi:group I intron endonuclease